MMMKNIFVQLLPIVRSGGRIMEGRESGKVLLVHWNHGDFKNRYTGMIKKTDLKGEDPENLTGPKNNEIRKSLELTARSLLPSGLSSSSRIKSLDLMAILEFTDHPACDEYVYVAELDGCDDASPDSPLHFESSPCYWFDFKEIPFQDMPKDDALWYPQVLFERKLVRGSFTFGSWEEKEIKKYWVTEVDKL